MTRLDVIRSKYQFPSSPATGKTLEPRQFQADVLNTYGLDPRHGYYWQPGVGKTLGATLHSLSLSLDSTSRVNRWIITMPPILIPNWQRFLTAFIDKETGKRLTVTPYVGGPKDRKKLPLNSNYTLMSYDIFKRDFEHLYDNFRGTSFGGICDEGHAIKNYESQNHRAHKEMFEGQPLMILTGTPVTKPDDAFGYCRLISPGVYRNKRHFDNLHVAERDEYDNVTEWQNLELLRQNMSYNSSRILKSEHLNLPPVTYAPIFYDLDKAHLDFYRRVADEKLVELENGGELNMINESKLNHALQQLVLNWAYFEQDTSRVPKGLELLDEIVDELQGEKLLVSANYRLTNELLQRRYPNAAYIYGGMGATAQQNNLNRFIRDPGCTLMFIQPLAAGQGVDGLQHVCCEMLMIECPGTPKEFEQVVARLDREGQTRPVTVRIAVAQRTLQVRRHKRLLEADELANEVQGNFQDLREAIYGG